MTKIVMVETLQILVPIVVLVMRLNVLHISLVASSIFFWSSKIRSTFSLRFSNYWRISLRLLISWSSSSTYGSRLKSFLFWFPTSLRRALSPWLVSKVLKTKLVVVAFFDRMMWVVVVVVKSSKVDANVGHLFSIASQHQKQENTMLKIWTFALESILLWSIDLRTKILMRNKGKKESSEMTINDEAQNSSRML
jgi:hypothetical protein